MHYTKFQTFSETVYLQAFEYIWKPFLNTILSIPFSLSYLYYIGMFVYLIFVLKQIYVHTLARTALIKNSRIEETLMCVMQR